MVSGAHDDVPVVIECINDDDDDSNSDESEDEDEFDH